MKAQIFPTEGVQQLMLVQEWNELSLARANDKEKDQRIVSLVMSSETQANPNYMSIPKVARQEKKGNL